MADFILVTPNSTVTLPSSSFSATSPSSVAPKLLIGTSWIERVEAVAPSSTYQGGSAIHMATGVKPIIMVADTLVQLQAAPNKKSGIFG